MLGWDSGLLPINKKENWRGGKKTHASSPSTSGKTNEKPSVIQTRLAQCTIVQDCYLWPGLFSAFHVDISLNRWCEPELGVDGRARATGRT